MATVRQPSFAGGELSPYLHARPDIAKYAVGAARLKNFFVAAHGPAVSRPGTQYVAESRVSGGASWRLIPFTYASTSVAQNYVLEFGGNYIRFYTQGALVKSGPSAFEVSTPYAASELRYLRYVQSGDTMTLTHPAHAPMELRRTSLADTGWVLSTPYAGLLGALSIHSFSYAFGFAAGGADAEHPALPWVWAVSVMYRDANGAEFESTAEYQQPESDSGPENSPVYADRPVVLSISVSGSGAPTILGYRIYRGQSGVFGLVGASRASGSTTFTDLGAAPDYSQPPYRAENPFSKVNGFHSVVSGTVTTDYPACAAYFEDRLVFARTDSRPAGLFFSATSDYYNFDEQLVPVESMQANFDLASRRHEEVRALVARTKLMALTNSGVWAVGGANGPLAYNSIDAKLHLEVGANWVTPEMVDGAVVFANSKGVGLHAVEFSLQQESFQGMDLSLLSRHLFEGDEVVDMAYQETPWNVLWVVMASGRLLSLTALKSQDVWAWAWHETDGKVTGVCVVPEGAEDAVYLQVLRLDAAGAQHWYVEKLARRRDAVRGDWASGTAGEVTLNMPWCLDCAVQQGNALGLTTVTGLSHLEGRAVMAVGDGVVYGPLTVVGGQVTLPEARKLVTVGLPYTCELETLNPIVPGAETRLVEKQVTRVVVEVADSSTFEVGPTFETLRPWRSRTLADAFGAVQARSEAAEVRVKGGWGPDGRVCIRQANPLPLTVLGVTREVEFGDR